VICSGSIYPEIHIPIFFYVYNKGSCGRKWRGRRIVVYCVDTNFSPLSLVGKVGAQIIVCSAKNNKILAQFEIAKFSFLANDTIK
jgi:hypothetical protein